HEGHGAGGVGAGAGHVRAAGAQGGELVTDAAAGLEGEARLVDLAQDVVHGVADGAGDRAVDGAGGGLVLQGAGVGGDAAGGDGAVAQRPQELVVPLGTLLGGLFHVRQGARDALPGVIDGVVDDGPVLGLESVLLVPDVGGGFLHGNLGDGRVGGFEDGVHLITASMWAFLRF